MEERPDTARRPAEPVPLDDPRLAPLRLLVGVVDRLRAPDGCPWDREQTLASMAPQLLEEAHELLDAIERDVEQGIVEEAGDVLMNVALIAHIGQAAGRFDLGRMAGATAEKLVRRHPHVFGETRAADARAALASWEEVKRREREDREGDTSALAGLPRSLPALQLARRTTEKAMGAGFRWPGAAGALEQLGLELGELREALAGARLDGPAPLLAGEPRQRAEEELGDVLFAGACLAAYLDLDPEAACRGAVRRFEERFRRLERESDRPLAEVPLPELVERWRQGRTEGTAEG